MPLQVAVCGPRHCTEDDKSHAYEVGILLAQAGAIVICGGGTGVMAAVAAGVRAGNGLVIGVRPGNTATDASPDLSAVIVTNLGEARNAIIVWSADAVIAIGGSWGTLSEIALAKRRGDVPVITLGSWIILDRDGNPLPESVTVASSPRQAVDLALAVRPVRPQETI
ncbi:dethiobiotin synthetase [Kibdelosporangium aridum]|uniref:Dethiobiotin synthetase n=1 Tax=Kibdelosporangium aridum TaxID=2030 RepID=A0A428Z700_KIBAR|nr:LOG family protein [Kibdelosporangium aridum]RSM83190.1 dethiobiotin synthetase [Kibdelosporangium aridum]